MIISKKFILWATVIVCIFFITGCIDEEKEARQRIEDITEIEVPSNSTMLFHYRSETFVGRSSQYTVFAFEKDPEYFLMRFKTKDVYFEKQYDYQFNAHVNGRYSNFRVPNEYLVDWDTRYLFLWLNEVGVFFIYFTDNQNLIVFIIST